MWERRKFHNGLEEEMGKGGKEGRKVTKMGGVRRRDGIDYTKRYGGGVEGVDFKQV